MSQPVVLLLAAGKSERWRAAGGAGHKLDAALGDSTVFAHALTRAIASGCEVRVAISKSTPPTVTAMCRMLNITTLMCTGGMGDVIAQAVRQTFSDSGWLIAPADMPCIRKTTYAALVRALTQPGGNAIIAAPFSGEQRGHPVGFATSVRNDLIALTGDTGARSVLERHAVTRIAVDDPGILLDIDSPGDLYAAQNQLT
ncbi:MAG: nucleotidyltransferase family protein [Burkholderiaceae bacterium]